METQGTQDGQNNFKKKNKTEVTLPNFLTTTKQQYGIGLRKDT